MKRTAKSRPRFALHTQVLIGLLIGLVVGLAVNGLWTAALWRDLGVDHPPAFLGKDPQLVLPVLPAGSEDLGDLDPALAGVEPWTLGRERLRELGLRVRAGVPILPPGTTSLAELDPALEGLPLHALGAEDVSRLGLRVVPANADPSLVGVVARFLADLNRFIGDLFVRLLRFVAVPIVLFSLIVGASGLNDLKKLSRIGGKTIGTYLFTTSLALTVGLALANFVQPGSERFVAAATRDRLAAAGAGEATSRIQSALAPDVWNTLLNIVPQNPFAAIANGEMLQVVFFALVVGIALTLIPKDKAAPIMRLCDGMTDVVVKLVHLVMRAAPYAVFALIVKVVAELGTDVVSALIAYSLVVVIGLAVMILGVYPLILRIGTRGRMGFRRFFRGIAPAQLLAFSSSSSSATLPVTMKCAEERLGVGEQVSSFVIPVGATVNMDGTALYQGVTTVFIAQMFGLPLSLTDQLMIVLTATLASIGAAGVPGIGMVMLIVVLQAVDMPPVVITTGIAIVLGVERILDMCRTVCNVTGDAMVAVLVAATEGELLDEGDSDSSDPSDD